jgi:hypothetical protein
MTKTEAARRMVASVAALVGCVCPQVAAHRTQPGPLAPAAPISIACSPDRPTVRARETITVRAWADLGGPPPRFSWTATGGRLNTRGAEASWDFAGAAPGSYAATVRVSEEDRRIADCRVEVVVVPPASSRGRESGWSFLISGRAEEGGYGLYSYLLLGSPPAAASRDRYRRTVEAYIGLVPEVTALEQFIRRRELNVTYLPIANSPPAGPVAIDWTLAHYDYARARAILATLPGNYRDGPYLVSSLGPLSETTTAAHSPYLLQDLSGVPPHLAALWMKEFLNQAAQERFWEESTARRLAVKLRTTVAVLALGLPDVRAALEDAVDWRR